MRGLRLFIRPIEPSDAAAITDFLAASSPGTATPACGLLAKLLGRIVAVAGFDLAPDALRLESLVVDEQLRRRRIGRTMVGEVADFAIKMDRRKIFVLKDASSQSGADDFLQRVGFVSQEDRWVRISG